VLRCDETDEHSPAEDVQANDEGRHASDRAPLLPAEFAAKAGGHITDGRDTWC
jgi:hypothetical protein